MSYYNSYDYISKDILKWFKLLKIKMHGPLTYVSA